MKTLIFLLFATAAHAQLSVGDSNTSQVMTMQTDTMSVQKSFELLSKLCKGTLYDRKVIYHGETYFQFGISFGKRKTYLIDGKKMIRI